ncbi:hypothetical protein [Novosphingobium aquae]|uniref:Uncharacterized protein n=1 Tax=Novosphingobium aquae TaxID=3133435 RepID=A0ABU8S609_9SPHN
MGGGRLGVDTKISSALTDTLKINGTDSAVTKVQLNLIGPQAILPGGFLTVVTVNGGAQFTPNDALWATSDENSHFQRLGTIDTRAGKFTPRSPEARWGVEGFLHCAGRIVHRLCHQ